jgi:flagellar hook-length control protein FliK
MTMSGLSLLAGLMPATQDASTTTGAAPDGADAFAAMMADFGKSSVAAAPVLPDDGKDGLSPRAKGDDDVKGDDKDSRKTQEDSDAALMTMLGVPVPLTLPAPPVALTPVATVSKDETPASEQDSPLAASAPAPAPAAPLSTADANPPIDPKLVLAALEEQTKAPSPTPAPVTPQATKPVGREPATPAADKASTTAPQPAATPLAPTAIATHSPAPAEPLPATAALLAARIATVNPATPAETHAPAAPARKVLRDDDRAADDADPDIDPQAASAPAGAHVAPAAKSSTVTPADNAGQVLAAGTADRHLDLAKQGAWLDGLARDIATTGASTGTVRFEVSPQHLGTVQVELKRGDDGSAVTLTATSEASRVALSDARPQLIAEARAHGIHISNAQVDVGTGDTGSNRDSQSQPSSRQSDSRGEHAAGNGGFSTQTGNGGNMGQRSQTRSQPLGEYQNGATRTGRGGAASNAPTPAAVAAADTRYA